MGQSLAQPAGAVPRAAGQARLGSSVRGGTSGVWRCGLALYFSVCVTKEAAKRSQVLNIGVKD